MENDFKLPLIVFDSECSLCVRFTQALKLLDIKNTLNFESLYNENLYKQFNELDRDECEKEVHLVLDGEILKGPEVVEYLVERIPGAKKISWLIESEASKGAMNLFYKKINTMRLKQKKGCKTCGSK